jgi:predicted DCC family thiol-disulfide oxidoreductase YuxK
VINPLKSSLPPFSYREDPAVPGFPDDHPIIIFDGHCVLCSGFAGFVLRHDKRATFRLMAGQSPLGQAIYRHLGLDPTNFETNILLYQGRAWYKSQGSLKIFQLLGFPWSASVMLKAIPAPLLDRLYNLVARNRLKWFGRRDQCFLADPTQRDRFLG